MENNFQNTYMINKNEITSIYLNNNKYILKLKKTLKTQQIEKNRHYNYQ